MPYHGPRQRMWPLQLPTLVYWGFEPPLELFAAGVALWSVAALLFITPVWAATNILLVGGINLCILAFVDGTVRLVSKLCFYCLLLSILWLLEPLWTRPLHFATKDNNSLVDPFGPPGSGDISATKHQVQGTQGVPHSATTSHGQV